MSEAPPRIIFVNRLYWPAGAATAQLLSDLAEGLAARGFSVHVVAAGTGATHHHGVTIHRTGTPENHGGLVSRVWNHRSFLRAARGELNRLVQAGDTVVALTDPPLLGILAATVARERGARVIHWIQDIYPEIASVHFGALARWLLAGLAHRRDRAWQEAGACVTLGAEMGHMVASRGVDPARIHLLPNWAPRELDAPATAEAIAAKRAAWECTGKFIVAYSGNLGRVHEFATLLDAAERLRDDPQVVFLFIGRGARYPAVAEEIKRRRLTNVRLLLPEPRSSLAAALGAADVHAVTLAPAYSGLVYPSKLAGALAAGRPVVFVGSADGEIARLLKAQDCGAGLAPGQGEALATLIKAWRADDALRHRLGANARTVFSGRFDLASALDHWEALLQTPGAGPKFSLPPRS